MTFGDENRPRPLRFSDVVSTSDDGDQRYGMMTTAMGGEDAAYEMEDADDIVLDGHGHGGGLVGPIGPIGPHPHGMPHPLVTLACLGGLGYALPAIAWRPDLLPPPDFAFGLGEFMLFLAEDYRQGGLGDFRVFCIQYSAERLYISECLISFEVLLFVELEFLLG